MPQVHTLQGTQRANFQIDVARNIFRWGSQNSLYVPPLIRSTQSAATKCRRHKHRFTFLCSRISDLWLGGSVCWSTLFVNYAVNGITVLWRTSQRRFNYRCYPSETNVIYITQGPNCCVYIWIILRASYQQWKGLIKCLHEITYQITKFCCNCFITCKIFVLPLVFHMYKYSYALNINL